jgi:hypothetical protein
VRSTVVLSIKHLYGEAADLEPANIRPWQF